MDANFEAMVRYRRGMDVQALMDQLIIEGCEPKAAEDAVMRVHNRIRSRDRKRGFTNLIFGLLIFAIGTAASLWLMIEGGFLVYTYAAALGGAGMFLTGAVQIFRAGKDRELARL